MLVSTAADLLPQAKKKQLQRAHRVQSLAAAKKAKKDVSEDEVGIAEMPWDIIRHVFDRLDPYSLGKAACACHAWRGEAAEEHRWHRFCNILQHGNDSEWRAGQHWRLKFLKLAKGEAVRPCWLLCKKEVCLFTLFCNIIFPQHNCEPVNARNLLFPYSV